MTTVLIILALIVFIIYLFQSDKKEVIQKNIQRGGLAKRFPNFVEYCKNSTVAGSSQPEFVKDNGEYIEYRISIKVNDSMGYFHQGLQNSFGTFLYVFAISPKGRKINGPIIQVHNGKDRTLPEDLTSFEYEFMFSELIDKMENTKDFARKFMDE
jgi:hypothetical protein